MLGLADFSDMVMFFIILTTAITLNRHGITHIETTRQAAEALRPLSGNFARPCLLWALSASDSRYPDAGGINGIRLRGTFSGAKVWTKNKSRRAPFISHSSFNGGGCRPGTRRHYPVKALYWTAVIDGLVAPFLSSQSCSSLRTRS